MKKSEHFIQNRRTCILILGMHRSGTSCLAGSLKNMGVYLGPVSENNKYNKKGNQEGFAASLNEGLLKINGCSWIQPSDIKKHTISIKAKILFYCFLMEFNRIKFKNKYWGIKDPRILFCSNTWEIKKKKLIGTIRRPDLVVRSLQKRDNNISKLMCYEAWYAYNNKLIELYNLKRFPVINFDWSQVKYLEFLSLYARSIGLNDIDNNFFEASLRHTIHKPETYNEKYHNLYVRLCEIAENEYKKLLNENGISI